MITGKFSGKGKIYNQELSKEIEKAVYAALAESTFLVRDKAKELCPVRTGALQGSIAGRIIK